MDKAIQFISKNGREHIGDLGGNIFPYVAILLKLLSYVFVNYKIIALLFGGTSFVFLILSYLQLTRYIISDNYGVVCFLLFMFLCFFFLFHSLLLGNDLDRALVVVAPILSVGLYILLIRRLSVRQLDRVLEITGAVVIFKITFNLAIVALIYYGYIDGSKESLKIYYGKMADNSVWYESFSIFKVYEKSLVALPLGLLLVTKNRVSAPIRWMIIAAGTAISQTLSFYAAFIMTAGVVYVRKIIQGRVIFAVLAGVGGTIACFYFYAPITTLIDEKYSSILIKSNQLTEFWSFTSTFGVGIGSTSVPSLQSGDIFLENSYVLIVYWLGLLSVPLFILMGGAVSIAICGMFSRYNIAIYSLVIMSIFLSSGSNAYIFSGGVLTLLLTCIHRVSIGLRRGI